jgi:5-methylcytosine-specific restriction endonuclease McrA
MNKVNRMSAVNFPPRPSPEEFLSLEYALKDGLHVIYFALMAQQEGRCAVCEQKGDQDEPLHLHRARPAIDASHHPTEREDWFLVHGRCHTRAETMLFKKYGPALYGCANELRVGP